MMDKQLYILNVVPLKTAPTNLASSRCGPWQRLFTKEEADLIQLLGIQIGFCAFVNIIPVEMPKVQDVIDIEQQTQRIKDALTLMYTLEQDMHSPTIQGTEVSDDTIEFIKSLKSYNPNNF
jgi:hypothetical protein